MLNSLIVKEVWRDVDGFEGLYMVSNLGKVKNMTTGKLLHPTSGEDGRKILRLKDADGKPKMVKLHRLIAKAFIPNPNEYDVINHIDSNPANNDISNLEWCTQRQNIWHSLRFGNRERRDPRVIERLAKQGMTANEMVKASGYSRKAVDKYCKMTGVEPSRRRKYDIDIEELKRDFDNGMRNKDIAKKYKCTTCLIATRRHQYKKGLI